MNGIYVLIDPFNRADSGVTSYTRNAYTEIKKLGMRTLIISISPGEGIGAFCVRVSYEIGQIENLLCVEAPESLASTRGLDSTVPIHIRLHCSRSLGAIVQGMNYKAEDVAVEKLEIERSTFLSAPSWAAHFASHALFNYTKTPSIYPNPAPSCAVISHNPATYDVTFVGRYQKLKGIAALETIAASLPNLRFAVVCPPQETKTKSNITFLDGTSLSKSEIYALSNLVIVPSIFETSSMVAIEALIHGCHVITWEHLGVAEYFDSISGLIKIPTDDLSSFSKAVQNTAHLRRATENFNLANEVNVSFIKGLIGSMEFEKPIARTSRPNANVESYLRTLVTEQIKEIMKKKQSPFVKKTKKLIFHPIAFFRDSTEARYIRKKLEERKLKRLVSLKTEFKDHPLVAEKPAAPVTVIVKSPTVKAIVDSAHPKQKKIILDNYITSISDEGRIEFKVRPSKPAGYATAFLHKRDVDPELTLSILESLNAYDDFKYVNIDKMQLGNFDISEELSPLSIINRIDNKNKTNLGEINFIILLDAPANLCFALRHSGTEQRIILIKTEENLYIDPQSVDTVISLHPEKDAGLFSRLINLESAEDIPVAIRRALQEGFPRKKDMLLPVIFDELANFDRHEFLNFNQRYYQGILRIRPVDHQKSICMDDIYETLAGATVGLALLESVYMRYRSQCEIVENGGSPFNLIKACLKDGVLLDVQEI